MAISISTPIANQPFQRSGSSCDIQATGTYSGGTPTHVEARFNGGAWTPLSAEVISGGSWSGTLAGQAIVAGGGAFDVRWSNNTGDTATVAKIFHLRHLRHRA
jgi:hypothetical protein